MIEENRIPAAEANALITAGLFVRCMVEKKLI
jgi:hypothetical protein